MRSIPLFKVKMSENVQGPLQEVLQSGYIGQGKKVDEFEARLGEYFGNPRVTVVNSCTSAIHLALHMIKSDNDDPDRDEILTTPLSCTATNLPILANGLKLKWVDIDPLDCNVDLNDLARKIGRRTLGIMVVHWGGYPVDLDKLAHIQKEAIRKFDFRCLPVIEDCAHAFGSTYNGKKVGNSDNICCFSFGAIKHLTAGDGGALTFPGRSFLQYGHPLKERADLLRWYGLDRRSSADFRCSQDIVHAGFKFHMNDINATIGLENLKDIGSVVEKHQNNSNYLHNRLWHNSEITYLRTNEDSTSASWIFTMLVERRDDFVRMMQSKGVAAGRVHDRNDKHPCFQEFAALLPGTDATCAKMVCLPCGWWVTKGDCDYMVDCIREGW